MQRVIGLFFFMFFFYPVFGSFALIKSKLSYEDSVYVSLNKRERISKLLVLSVGDFHKEQDLRKVNDIVNTGHIGGVIISNGEKSEVKQWISSLKSTSFPQRPFVALNLPELLSFPLDGGQELPDRSKIELLTDDSLITDLGFLIGRQIREVGFDMVILDPIKTKADWWISKYLEGLKSAGVAIVAGSSDGLIKDNKIQVDQLKYAGVFVNKLDTSVFEGEPYDLEKRKEIGFSGLFLSKPEYSDNFSGDICFQALEKGADMVLLPQNIELAKDILHTLFSTKPPKNKILKEKGKQVIRFKRELDLLNQQEGDQRYIDIENINEKALFGSVVLLKNESGIFPIRHLDKYHFASISGNTIEDNTFRKYIDKYTGVAHYDFGYFRKNTQKSVETLHHFDVVLANITSLNLEQSDDILFYLKQINEKSHVVVIYSGDKKYIEKLLDFETILWTPSNEDNYVHLIPQNIFGARKITGRLHWVSAQDSVLVMGETIPETGRFKYGNITGLQVDTDELFKIDIVVKDAIEMGAFPGCQVFMAKNGTVVYNKSFGHLTYDSTEHVDNETIYDIASITKVVATVPSLMFLADWNKISLEDSLGSYINEFANSDKSGVKLTDLLTHQSGLKSYLPFWRHAEFDPDGDDFRFKLPGRRRYKYKTLSINWADSIRSWIVASGFNSLKKDSGGYEYLYSDLGFMVLKDLAENQLNQSIDEFLSQNLFDPMGMSSTGYAPLCRFPIDRISPTEKDDYLRNSLVWGNVHDRNAALLDGISGHAGLFSNASDLGKYMQMLLQKGYYGGNRYFSEQTVQKFIKKQGDSNRRALGWDKPDSLVENASKYASDKAFGHSGFTGTIVWADPEYDLVYVFLSNRVYPDAQNNKLIQNNIRTRIHDIMYESFLVQNDSKSD
ncbi:serine hydrolase [Reichenbachiella sp. MALMAid0571]|uniref:serine hydrolase domain-containing protein n=1 Tax=Reichenbachiella sp. MALMAid0571 TaxID=3143939 RepID=UPI0032DFA965